VQRNLELSERAIQAIARICVRLDGLPLALELAAAHANVLSPVAMLGRLDSHLSLLSWDSQDWPRRHRTMRAALDWSYNLLGAHEQCVLRRLAVFAGGFSVEAAQAVLCPNASQEDLLTVLIALVDKSMVQVREQVDGEPRFSLLATIRDYARNKLAARGELAGMEAAHASYFVQLAASIGWMTISSEQVVCLLERERDNLHAALLSIDPERRAALACHMASLIARFWQGLGYVGAGYHWLFGQTRQGLEVPAASLDTSDGVSHANALTERGLIMMDGGDLVGAAQVLRESVALQRAAGNLLGVAWTLASLGEALRRQGNYAQSEMQHREMLAIARAEGYERYWSFALNKVAWHAANRGDRTGAVELLRESLALSRRDADRVVLVNCLEAVVELAAEDGDAYELAQLLGAIETLREVPGSQRPLEQLVSYRETADRVHARLDEPHRRQACLTGRDLSLDALMDLAVLALDRVVLSRAPGPGPVYGEAREEGKAGPRDAMLSSREAQVLQLIAAGRSNKEIAATLYISRNTVKTHVTSILNKLGADNRVQAIAVAAQQRLPAARAAGGPST
jgi:non-specific serine/threonine protein kinase